MKEAQGIQYQQLSLWLRICITHARKKTAQMPKMGKNEFESGEKN